MLLMPCLRYFVFLLLVFYKCRWANLLTFKQPGWYLKFSVWFMENMSIIWWEKDKIMK